MKTYEIGQNLDIVVSTKGTLIGAGSSEFTVVYAPSNDLTNETVVSGGMTEKVDTVTTPHTATVANAVSYGATYIDVDSGHDIVSGDVIEYDTGKYVYVTKATSTRLYLRTKVRANVSAGATLTQVGNSGVYKTAEFAIGTVGEYIVTIESPEHALIVEDRIRIVDTSVDVVIDPNAPDYSEVAVAY